MSRPHLSDFIVVLGALVMFVVFAIMLAGIQYSSSPEWTRLGGVYVWTDPATGCRYTSSDVGMQPLVGPDGRPDCVRRPS